MARYKPYDYSQSVMLPLSLEEQLTGDAAHVQSSAPPGTPRASKAPAQPAKFYVRKMFGADPDSPFAMLWADGHADKLSISRIYSANRDGSVVRRLPNDMDGEYATPETVEIPE